MYVCVCVCVCVCASMYAWVGGWMKVCMHVLCLSIYMSARMGKNTHMCTAGRLCIPPRQGGHALAADSFPEVILGSVREAVGQRARRGAMLVAAHKLALEFLTGRKRVYAAA